MQEVKHPSAFPVLSSPTDENLPRKPLPGTTSFGDKRRTLILPGFAASLVWRHFGYSLHGQISAF